MDKQIPTIYASIGDRPDVNTRPTSRDAVVAVLTVSGERERLDRIEHPELYIAQLEQAVREAMSPQFLADSLRVWAREQHIFDQLMIEELADAIAKQSL